MCPICWASALASFGALLVTTVLAVAASDRWTVLLAAILGIESLAHRTGVLFVPWWFLLLMTSGVIARVSYLLVHKRDQLIVVRAWERACRFAADRCPRPERNADN